MKQPVDRHGRRKRRMPRPVHRPIVSLVIAIRNWISKFISPLCFVLSDAVAASVFHLLRVSARRKFDSVNNVIKSCSRPPCSVAFLALFFRPEPAPSVSLALSNHRFAQFQGKKRSVDDAIRVTNKSRRSIFSRRPNKTLHRQSQSNGD